MSFYFLLFLQYTTMLRITSGKKTFRIISKTFFQKLNFLFNCVKMLSNFCISRATYAFPMFISSVGKNILKLPAYVFAE